MMENAPLAHHLGAARGWSPLMARFLVVIGLAALGLVLAQRVVDGGTVEQVWWLVAFLVVGLADVVAGAALMNRVADRRLACCLVVAGFAAVAVVVLATSADGYAGTIGRPGSWVALRDANSWARPLSTGVLVALVPWELAVNGRSRVFEAVWWTTAALVAVTVIGEAANVPAPGIDVVDIATWAVAGSATAAVTLLCWRWWRQRGSSDDPLRGWLAAGAVVGWLAVVPERIGVDRFVDPDVRVVGALMLVATLPLLIVGVLVRAMREHPGRFHGVAHDVIGWLVLSGAIVAVYTVVVVGLGSVFGSERSTWWLVVATAAIAISAETMRGRVRVAVDRLVWGARDDPLEVVRGVIERVGADPDGDLLPSLVESLRQQLKVEMVAIEVGEPTGWRRVASTGPTTTHQRIVPLVQRDDVVGRLVVGWEHGPHLRTRDERVLDEVAGPLGLAVGWVRQADQLRRATVDVASTREEERRRMRRDLHDGLGPALTGVSLGLHTAARQLERHGPGTVSPSHALVAQAAADVDALVIEVKRIVRDLRPTALDALGLVDAIGEFTRTFGEEIQFHVTVPSAPLEFPAAAEVAVYRIVTEAVTNVVRHAGASECWIDIGTESGVEIVVCDDGSGVDDEAVVGVGWTAMRERAHEFGGTLRVDGRVPCGTRVFVDLPAVAT